MKSVGCTPQSLPPVPDCTTHPLWQSWDIACEMCLMHVSALNKGAAMTDPLNNIPLGKTPKSANPADAAGSANPSQLTGSGTVPGLVADAATTSLVVQRSTFFTDHLTAFEIWLDFEAGSGDSPALLPIVLQVGLLQYSSMYHEHIGSNSVCVARFCCHKPTGCVLCCC
jgi:regulator-associated protein of mTOR